MDNTKLQIIHEAMKAMQSAMEDQATHYLGVMQLNLNRFGLSFPQNFEEYLMESLNQLNNR